jgi:Cys-rich four helix bundle protein (predicted Tat secretion target)
MTLGELGALPADSVVWTERRGSANSEAIFWQYSTSWHHTSHFAYPTRHSKWEKKIMSADNQQQDASTLTRRNVLVAAAAFASASLAGGSAWAAEKHDHATHAPQDPKLVEALEACNSTGRLCVSHCLASFREGDTALAACAAKVHEMLAVCSAMSTLAASNSTYAPGMAAICAKVCQDCSAECKKHAAEHQECKACMEACDRVVPLLKQLMA